MTDHRLLDKKLAFIENRIRELRELAQPEQIGHDLRETRFVEPETSDSPAIRERVEHLHTGAVEILSVARYNDQIMDKRGGGD